jgi:hypothetical protein
MNCFKLCSFQINFWVGTAVSAAPDQPPLARLTNGDSFLYIQRDQQGLKLLAANDSKIFPKYEIFLCVSVGTRCKL